MFSRSTLATIFAALPLLGLCGCKTVYSDTYSYRKNSFKPPATKQPTIVAPKDAPLPTDGVAPDGLLPGGAEGLPGAPVPDAGGAMPGAIPGLPDAAPAPGAAPAIPGLN